MDKYIGIKLIEAEPMNLDQAERLLNRPMGEENLKNKEGYLVKYEGGYKSWSPKDVFEKAYMKVTPNQKLKSDISISQEMVDNFIKETHVDTVGDKTTVVRAVLRNGFEIVDASACVDKSNYDEEYGSEICMEKIKDKIWCLLGFLLQTAINGIE